MPLIHAFDEIARARPDALALVSSVGSCSYAELRARVQAVALHLQECGVASETPVGISIPRSLESVIAVLGVLWAGGVYVPIDPAYPVERQRSIAADAGVAALVIASDLERVPSWAESTQTIDVCRSESLAPGVDPPKLADTSGGLLNILYTSGSTGRPKGVCGTQAAMLNRLSWAWEQFPFRAGEVVGHRSSLNFVDAGPEMFSGLLRGIPTVVLLPDEQADLARFTDALERHRVTRLTVVPSILAAMLRTVPDFGRRLDALWLWVTSGEELTMPLLRSFRASHPGATLVNLYGTTEVTGDVTCAVFGPETPLPSERVAIGRSIAGAELLVLDDQGAPVPEGETGELHVAGPVLAQGYHHRPQEDGVRFPRHPSRPLDRTFRTGDLVRRAPDGTLFYLGRVDNLVKIRGIRVELEEIDRCLLAECPSLHAIAAVLENGERLVAFVSPATVDLDQLRATAERLLPAVMVPSRFIPIAALPLLPNGKCDRRALAALVHVTPREIPPDRRPSTVRERQVASLWKSLLRREDIARDDTFAALGGDSLELAELLAALDGLESPGRVEFGLARDGTLEAVARALDANSELGRGSDPQSPEPARAIDRTITLSPMGEEGVRDPRVIAMLVEASMDPALCSATELPAKMDPARARAYCLASDGVVIRLDGVPVGAGLVQHHPNVGAGVEFPADAVQLDEWLIPQGRGLGILSEAGAWPLLAEWLAQRFETEVSVVWEDHVAMIAILRARGYTRLGRSYWTSRDGGDGSGGWCEVWMYDLRPHAPPGTPSAHDGNGIARRSTIA